MGTFSIIVLVLAGIVAAILVLAARKPDNFRIERRILIDAAPETVFPNINDLAAFQGWSPWAKKDPAARYVSSAVIAGVDASLAWQGNNQVGSGKMTIIESVPHSRVKYRLDFFKPFKATNTADFSILPSGGGTEVVWAMYGPAPLMSKTMDLLMNMDKMVGRDFEAGLSSLKGLVETKA